MSELGQHSLGNGLCAVRCAFLLLTKSLETNFSEDFYKRGRISVQEINWKCYLLTMHRFALASVSWWRHQMETFSALLALCVGNSPVTAEFPSQRPVTRDFDVFFDPRLNKRLSEYSWGRWFETLSRRSDVTEMLLSHVTCFLKSAANISWRHQAKEQCCGLCTGGRGSHSVCRGALAIVSYKGRGLPALVQIMTWRRTGAKPLSEPMIIHLIRVPFTMMLWEKRIIFKALWDYITLKTTFCIVCFIDLV